MGHAVELGGAFPMLTVGPIERRPLGWPTTCGRWPPAITTPSRACMPPTAGWFARYCWVVCRDAMSTTCFRTCSSRRTCGSANCASHLRSAAGSRPSRATARPTHLRQSREHDELPPELPGGDAIEADTLIVLDAIRKLPDAYRETLLMRLVEGMSGAEIADRTGLSPARCA